MSVNFYTKPADFQKFKTTDCKTKNSAFLYPPSSLRFAWSCGPSIATWFLFHFRPYKKICCFPGELKDWKSHFAKDKRVQCNNSKKKKTHFTWKTHKMTRKSWCGGPGQTKYFAKTIKGEILVILTNIALNEVMYTKETLDVHTKKGLTVYSAKDFFSPDL